jgi:hypothetical protein
MNFCGHHGLALVEALDHTQVTPRGFDHVASRPVEAAGVIPTFQHLALACAGKSASLRSTILTLAAAPQ